MEAVGISVINKLRQALVLDIGGSTIKCGIAKIESSGLHLYHAHTVEHFGVDIDALYKMAVSLVHNVLIKYPFLTTISISTAGFVDSVGTVVYGTLENYQNFDWSSALKHSFPTINQVFVANDGHCATLAVHEIEGRILNSKCHVHFVIGTGVGGGIVLDGCLLKGAHGFAGHLGHILCGGHSNLRCSCSLTGCVETMACGRAISFRAQAKGMPTSISLLASRLSERMVQALFFKAGKALGIAVATVIRILDPDLVTLGGGVIDAAWFEKRNFYAEGTAYTVNSLRLPHWSPVIPQVSALGNQAGLYGAGVLALLKTPTEIV